MKSRIITYATAAIGLAFLWLIFIHHPLNEKHRHVLLQTAEAEAQLVDYSNTISRLPEFLARSNSLEVSRLQLQSSLYAKEDIMQLLDQLNQRTKASRLVIAEIIPPVSELLMLNRTAHNPSEPHFLNITLRIHGRYVDFGAFVSELEKAPYFRGINTCRISGSSEPGQTVSYSVGFKALLGDIGEKS